MITAARTRALVTLGVALGLAGTLGIGLWLRWRLTGLLPVLPIDRVPFAFARHAHSHLGYYAVLVPLGWLAWRARGLPALGPREIAVYATFTLLATVGFVQAGYGLLGIVGSTVVGALWLVAAFRVARRIGITGPALDDPLLLVFPGTLAALACVPLIALSLRRDPPLAAAAVQSFLAILLLLVVAPSAAAAPGTAPHSPHGRRVRVRRMRAAPLLLLAGLGAGAALGLWTAWPARLGLAMYALWWLDMARALRASPPFATAWALGGAGMLGLAVGVVPNVRDVAIGAVHFLVLGPLLPSLATPHLVPAPNARAWWLHLAAVTLLAAPLVWRGVAGGSAWTATASAMGGTAVVAWWVARVLSSASQRRLRTRPPSVLAAPSAPPIP